MFYVFLKPDPLLWYSWKTEKLIGLEDNLVVLLSFCSPLANQFCDCSQGSRVHAPALIDF